MHVPRQKPTLERDVAVPEERADDQRHKDDLQKRVTIRFKVTKPYKLTERMCLPSTQQRYIRGTLSPGETSTAAEQGGRPA